MSRLSRGAWIKMPSGLRCLRRLLRRVSHEARGLKLYCNKDDTAETESRLSRGAWIKISGNFALIACISVASLTRRVD